jgi:hypothetical protein
MAIGMNDSTVASEFARWRIARSLALHRLVAEKVRRDPALFERAKATLARWRRIGDASTRRYDEEWDRIMALGLEATLAVMLDESEHAADMRKNSRFAGILTYEERQLQTWEAKRPGRAKKRWRRATCRRSFPICTWSSPITAGGRCWTARRRGDARQCSRRSDAQPTGSAGKVWARSCPAERDSAGLNQSRTCDLRPFPRVLRRMVKFPS